MNKLIQLLAQQGDTTDSQQWLKWYRTVREKTAMEPHNVELIEIDANKIVLEMEITDNERQPYGLLHGGISMMLAESAASIHSSWGLDLTKEVPVGIELNGSHLRSAREGKVRAVATVIRRGKKLVHHHIEIIHVDSGNILSTIRMTNFIRKIG